MSRPRPVAAAFAALVVAGLGLWGAPARAAEPAKTCKLAQLGELPVRFERNRPLIEAEMNGRKAWLLADTGAWKTALFGGAAKGLGLSPKQLDGMTIYGAGGYATAQAVTVASFKLGGYGLSRPTLLVLGDVGGPDDVEAGLLGRDLFSRNELELDLKNARIRLLRAEGCRNADLAYWSKTFSVALLRRGDDDGYYTNVILNGKPVPALIDSGAAVSYVSARAAALAGVTPKAAVETDVARGVGPRAIPTYTATFAKLEIGDETVSNVKLRVGDLFKGTENVSLGSLIAKRPENLTEVILGADFLRAHRVLLSSSQGRMYFTYNGGPIFQAISSDPPVAGAPSKGE